MRNAAFFEQLQRDDERSANRGGVRDIGGGPSLVNRRRPFTRTLKPRAILSLPMTTECATSAAIRPLANPAHPKDRTKDRTMNRAAYRAWTRPLSTILAGAIRTSVVAAIAALALFALPAVPAFAQAADPVVAKVDGVEVRESDWRSPRRTWANIPPQVDRRRQARLHGRLSRRHHAGGEGRRGQEGHRQPGVQDAASPSPATSC